ncbi:hypothetical protein EPUL_002736, partial [Erysiphe pulchra]
MSKFEDATLLLPITEEMEFKPWAPKEATEATSTDIANYIETRIDGATCIMVLRFQKLWYYRIQKDNFSNQSSKRLSSIAKRFYTENSEEEGTKDVEMALTVLITKLHTIQSGLNQSFKNEPYLYAKVLTTFRGHPATRAACSTYSNNNSVTDLLNRLQACIATWKAERSYDQVHQQQFDQESSVHQTQFFTDRRFQGQRNRHTNHSYKGTSQDNIRNKNQICFVRRKEGCWSTRHTEQERRKINQQGSTILLDTKFEEKLDGFIVEYEGQDPSDIDTELIDHFNYFSLENNESETFHTTCGKMTKTEAFKT